MPEELNFAENYAVLFVGSGNSGVNFARYYNSLKGIYEVLTSQYALPLDNVYVLFADKGQSIDRNRDDLSSVAHLKRQEGVKLVQEFGSSIGYNLSIDQANLLRLGLNRELLSNEQSKELSGLVSQINNNQSSLRIDYEPKAAQNDSGVLPKLDIFQKSDLSFANGSRLSSATPSDLRGALNDLSTRVDSNDHVFFWTFDHGGFGPAAEWDDYLVDKDGNFWSNGKHEDDFNWGRRDVGNKANLIAWGNANIEIDNADLAQWVDPLVEKSGYTTLVYNQCYAGGMLEASLPVLKSAENAYGMSATNAYERSNAFSFAAGVQLALQGSTDPKANLVFARAKDSDKDAARYPYADNDGPLNDNEHPWAFGGTNGDFSVFSVGNSQHPLEQQDIDLLEVSEFSSESIFDQRFLVVKEDTSLDLRSALVGQYGADVIVEAVNWPGHGSLDVIDGALTYIPMVDFHGTDTVLVRYSTPAGTGEVRLSLEVQPVNDAPLVSDDFVSLDSGANRVKFSIDSLPGFLGDHDPDGDNLRISSFSAPENGRLTKTGKNSFLYKPNNGFVGTDSFLYQVTDGEAYSVAEVSINVSGGAFSLDSFDGSYQLTSEDPDPIINPLRSRDGAVLSDASSERWDVVAAVSVGSTYKLLLQGEGRRDGFYRVWTADETGQVIDQTKRWLSPDQIEQKAYGKLFWGLAGSALSRFDGPVIESDGGLLS